MVSSRTRMLIAIAGLVCFCGCALPPLPRPGDPRPMPPGSAPAVAVAPQTLYTAHNMWCEKENVFACINYKRGIMIPAGTKVSAALTRGASGILRGKSVISFTVLSSTNASLNGQTYTVSFSEKFHPGKSIQDYFDMMFTDKDFDGLTAGMTPEEINAIRQGILVVGMSKQAVLVSYGPPPEHRTPSRDMNAWTYWTSRYATKLVSFDASGRTVAAPVAPAAPNQI